MPGWLQHQYLAEPYDGELLYRATSPNGNLSLDGGTSQATEGVCKRLLISLNRSSRILSGVDSG
jgi:hypothetical protein